MQNFPRQWPGLASDPQGARYAEWSATTAPGVATPFVEPYEPAYLQPLGTEPQPDNVSEYSVQDFEIYPTLFYEATKRAFPLDELGKRFCAPENVFAIHRELSLAVHEKFHIWIAKQNDTQLSEVMIKAYISFFNINHRTGDLEEDLYNLNVMVIKSCIGPMLSKLSMQIKQLMEIDRVAVPGPRPVNVSNRGLDGRSVFELDRFRFLPLAEILPEPDTRSRYAYIGNPATRNWADQVHDGYRAQPQ
jgi:hypothetical protein